MNADVDVLSRPEVLACQKRAQELRAEADEMDQFADSWAGMVDHHHRDEIESVECDDPLCYEAWQEYPDG